MMIKIHTDVFNDAKRFIKLLEDSDGSGIDEVMKSYFAPYWLEFKRYWLKEAGESIDWINFGLAPHNAQFFVEYVFTKYPIVRKQVMDDMDDLEKS